MQKNEYLMENDEEAIRLDIKTDINVVKNQALWAGLKPGMRVADICCGPGKTTSILHKLVQPKGKTIGIDFSEKRIAYAQKHYSKNGIEFKVRNIANPIKDLGTFDFIWIRFVLEYHRSNSFKIVKQLSNLLKPGGILCLIDLDYNCLTHFGLSEKLSLKNVRSGVFPPRPLTKKHHVRMLTRLRNSLSPHPQFCRPGQSLGIDRLDKASPT